MMEKISRCIGSLAVIRYFLRFICVPPSAWRMVALSAGLVVLNGCATSQDVKYDPAIRTTFSARSQPAKISNENRLSLMKRGYVRIGTVSAELANTDDTDPTPVILEKAASEGGDLVILDTNRELRTQEKYQRRCTRWGYVTYAYRQWACVEWGAARGGYAHTLHSGGSVWRHDPELARQEPHVKELFLLGAIWGDLQVVQDGLARGLSPNASPTGQLPLIEAAEHGHLAVVKLLIERGASVNTRDNAYGDTALMHAAKGGHTETVKFLLARGADVKVKNRYGWAVLPSAAGSGDLETVKALLGAGADIPQGILLNAAFGGNPEIIRLFLARGAKVEYRAGRQDAAEESLTPLMAAAFKGHTKAVEVLLAAGANVNAKNLRGETPLYLAAMEGRAEVAKALLAHGAEVDFYSLNNLNSALRLCERRRDKGRDPSMCKEVGRLLRDASVGFRPGKSSKP